MSDLIPKTYEIVLNGKESTNSACDTFVYEPENVEEEKLGYLYILGQVLGEEGSRKKGFALLSLLASQTSKNFFNKTQFESKEALEKALSETNRIFEREGKADRLSWAKRLNMSIVLLTPQTGRLCFAFRADSQGLLWRKGNLADITHQVAPDKLSEVDDKLFSTIASGNIILEDKIIFSSPGLKNKIPAKDLKSILDQTRYSGIENIKEILALEEDDDLALLVLDIQSSEKKLKKLIARPPPQEIVKEKPTVKSVTEELPVAIKTKKNLIIISSILANLITMAKKLVEILKKYIPKGFSRIKKAISSLRLPRKSDFSNFKFNIKNIHPKKLFDRHFFIVLIFVFIISISLVLLIFMVPRKKTKDIALEIPQDQEFLLDISKLTLSSNALGVFYRSNYLIIFDEDSIYAYSIKNQEGGFVFPELASGNNIAYQTEVEDYLIYLSLDDQIIKADKDLFSVETEKMLGLENEKIIDIDSFYNNVYVLTASGKILKYADLDFSAKSIWMNGDNASNRNYLSIAIDGSVYILERSGLIHKYDAGKKDKDFLITTEGLANSGDKIFTDVDFKNIYLMSQSQNKIIIFNKESQLPIKVIENPSWTKLKDLYISPHEKELYILDSLNVYRAQID